jgi:Caspase domain
MLLCCIIAEEGFAMERFCRLCRHVVVLGLAAFTLLNVAVPARAERRVALVIGNGAYQHAPQLPNPKNDAQDVAAALKRTGFETIVGFDLNQAQMQDFEIKFARAAREADVALFYYSGHAMQFNGINYLIPVDAKLADEADLRRMARLDDIVADLQRAKNLKILVLDSCRDNPLAEALKRSIGRTRSISIQRGLAKIESPQGMIVAYATQAGSTAEDGSGRNSPYTTAFLKHIEERAEIGAIFRRISADVYETTKRSQLPELSLSLIGEYYLHGRPAATDAGPAVAAEKLTALQERLRKLEERLKAKSAQPQPEPKVAIGVAPPLKPFVCTVIGDDWSQMKQHSGRITRVNAGYVLHGAPWTNGHLQNGYLDGNGLISKQAFDFSGGGIAYLQFIVDGAGRYMAIFPDILEGVGGTHISTHHSWAGSAVVPDRARLFAKVAVERDGRYLLTVSRKGYDAQVFQRHEGKLKNTTVHMQVLFGDNYAGPRASIVVEQAKICLRQ